MRIVDEKLYFTSGDVGAFVDRKVQTVNNWDKYSDILEERGEARLIPKPIRLNNHRLFTKEQVQEIKSFADDIKRGQMAEYTRALNGERGKKIMERVKEREGKQVEAIENELEKVLSSVNRRAVEFEDRFLHLKGTGKKK